MLAEIKIHISEKKNPIHPFIYGQFIEFIGSCIDKGIYDRNSLHSDENGFRKDVMEKVKQLKPPILRFPGGTVAKIYHWLDGVGPLEHRKRQSNRIWGGVIDHAFGTNEFIRYCREIGAELFLVVNMTTGTPEEAANWVEYCNGTGDTYYANLRRSHGFEEPHQVKYWGLGNEEAAVPDIGFLNDPQEYVKMAWEFAKLMKLADRTIQLVMVGEKPEWNRTILDGLHPICDYLSIHYYARSEDADYGNLFLHVSRLENMLIQTKQLLDEYPKTVRNFDRWYRFPPRQREIQLAIDEWGVWQNHSSDDYVSDLEAVFNWKEALFVASALHVFHRQSAAVTLSTFAQMVNILAPIMTKGSDSICQTIFYPLQMYNEHCGNWQLDCSSRSCDISSSGYETVSVQSLDISATYHDLKGEVVITVVNRHPSEAVRATIQFIGGTIAEIAEVHEVNCASWETTNSFESPEQVKQSMKSNIRYDVEGSYEFTPHSITILKHVFSIQD